jgi:hypothetical protein
MSPFASALPYLTAYQAPDPAHLRPRITCNTFNFTHVFPAAAGTANAGLFSTLTGLVLTLFQNETIRAVP